MMNKKKPFHLPHRIPARASSRDIFSFEKDRVLFCGRGLRICFPPESVQSCIGKQSLDLGNTTRTFETSKKSLLFDFFECTSPRTPVVFGGRVSARLAFARFAHTRARTPLPI